MLLLFAGIVSQLVFSTTNELITMTNELISHQAVTFPIVTGIKF